MGTKNFSATANTALNEDFTATDATSTDKILFEVFNATGGLILNKKSADYGGSTEEIAIVADTKYTVKLSAADTGKIPSGARYSLQRIEDSELEYLYDGHITVTGAELIVPEPQKVANIYRIEKTFTANGSFISEKPENMILLGAYFKEEAGATVTITIADSIAEPTTVFIADQEVRANEQILKHFDYYTFAEENIAITVSSGNWNDARVKIILLYTEIS